MRYAEAQASERRLYLNLIIWKQRSKLLFTWMAIISIMAYVMVAQDDRPENWK